LQAADLPRANSGLWGDAVRARHRDIVLAISLAIDSGDFGSDELIFVELVWITVGSDTQMTGGLVTIGPGLSL